MDQLSPESVTLDTLQLLRETVDYLKRLPVVPVTHVLCKKIEAHLADPTVATVARKAEETERLARTRVARRYGPAGNLMVEVAVSAEDVTYRIPGILEMRSLEGLRTGDTLKFQ